MLLAFLMGCSSATPTAQSPADPGSPQTPALEGSSAQTKNNSATEDENITSNAHEGSVAEGAAAAGGLEEESASHGAAEYVNTTYGFRFDPSFCKDLTQLEDSETSAHFRSTTWQMDLVVFAKENSGRQSVRELAESYIKQADPSMEPDVLVDEDGQLAYCLVVQAEKTEGGDSNLEEQKGDTASITQKESSQEGKTQEGTLGKEQATADTPAVVVYLAYVGSGNIEGLRASFPVKAYAKLTTKQAKQLIMSFMPGDVSIRHDS